LPICTIKLRTELCEGEAGWAGARDGVKGKMKAHGVVIGKAETK